MTTEEKFKKLFKEYDMVSVFYDVFNPFVSVKMERMTKEIIVEKDNYKNIVLSLENSDFSITVDTSKMVIEDHVIKGGVEIVVCKIQSPQNISVSFIFTKYVGNCDTMGFLETTENV